MSEAKDAGYWLKKEVAEAKRDGATPVRNSGRGVFKCDATLDDFGIDYKMSESSFTLNPAKWAKLVSDAWSNGQRTPTLKLVFFGLPSPLRLWVVDDATFKDYIRLRRMEDESML